jgi:uncharacterized protein YceH (UPF0502 family)
VESLDPSKKLNNQRIKFVSIMATQGKAAKSASGAAMSKYDVEVEARLKALEAKVAALESSDKAQQEVDARFIELETKVKTLWD